MHCAYLLLAGGREGQDRTDSIVGVLLPLELGPPPEELAAALQALPPMQQLLLLLYCYDQLSTQAAAALLALPPETVRSGLRRASRALERAVGAPLSVRSIRRAFCLAIETGPDARGGAEAVRGRLMQDLL